MKKEEIEILEKRLRETIPNGEWYKILSAMDLTGIADNRQLQAVTALGRDKLRRTLEKMELCRAGLPPLFLVSEKKLIRPNLQGRMPKVYLLGKSGAELLGHLGHKSARAYAQDNPIAMAHALAVFDLDLVAKQAGLDVQTEKHLSAGELYIRPDNLVTLESGKKLIFEIEQLAKPDYLPRITRSLRNKITFFRRNKDKQISSEIRVLFNLKPGASYRKTLGRWERVLQLLAKEEQSGELPFSLHVMTLAEFLADPDWREKPSEARWKALKGEEKPPPQLRRKDSARSLPISLKGFSSKQNLLVLEALWQEFQAQELRKEEDFVFPDPQFLELVQVIYLASHRKAGTALEQAAFPNASLYLLKQYLLMRPDLLRRLNKVMSKGGRAVHWSSVTILNRIQSIADEFLAYHGFRSTGTLKVFAQVVDWQAELPKSFTLQVKITTPQLLSQDRENYRPNRGDLRRAEQALSWVLRALFVHAERLGLYQLPF